MALTERQPIGGLLHHSDRGSQYASQEYQRLLERHGIVSRMSRGGNCWDNAVAESCFATLKLELVYGEPRPTARCSNTSSCFTTASAGIRRLVISALLSSSVSL